MHMYSINHYIHIFQQPSLSISFCDKNSPVFNQTMELPWSFIRPFQAQSLQTSWNHFGTKSPSTLSAPLSIPTVLVQASSFRTWHFRTSSVWWLMKLCRRAVGFKRWTYLRVCIIPVLFYPSDTNWRFEVVLICVGLGMFLIQHFKQYPKTKG